MPRWISYKTAAGLLGCTRQHISVLARAAEYRGQPLERTPVEVRPYIECGFPRPIRLSKKMVRIDVDELQKWIESR